MRLRVKIVKHGRYRTETKRFLRQLWMKHRSSSVHHARNSYISFTARLIVHYIPKRQIINAPQPACLYTHQGSNSWMMLSKRITAKSRELNPANQARKRMVNDSKDCHPAGCVSPPDRPPPLHPAGELGRPLPETEPPELELALCLQSEAVWCSAMFWRI